MWVIIRGNDVSSLLGSVISPHRTPSPGNGECSSRGEYRSAVVGGEVQECSSSRGEGEDAP